MKKLIQIWKKTSNACKADRTIHRVTFYPKRASPGEVLRVPVPKLDDGVVLVIVLVPVPLSLIFDLAVSGHANKYDRLMTGSREVRKSSSMH